MESDPILDSPLKRRKLNGDSDSDYGSDAFLDANNDTVATIVQPSRYSPASDTSTRVVSSPPLPSYTQPTQIMRSTPTSESKLSQILIPDTSPASEQRPTAPHLRNGSLMAPPGTVPRPPAFYRSKAVSPPAKPSLDIDDPPIVSTSDSDEELAGSRSDIPQTVFRSGSLADKFKKHVSTYTHSAVPQKRPAEDSVNAYASVSRGVARPSTQAVPSKAIARKIESLDDISDWELMAKVKTIRSILPNHSAQEVYEALLVKNRVQTDAMDYLVEREEKAKAKKDDIIDMTGSDDELAPSPEQKWPELKPNVKRTVNLPQKSLIQRYGGTQRKTAQPSQESPAKQDAAKPLRRLKQGFRARSRTPEDTPRSLPQDVIELADSDSDVKEDTEEETLTVDGDVLKWLNRCSDKDMVEIAECDIETAALMISKRPFRSLQQARNVKKEEQTQTAKKGKARGGNRKPIGERVVNVAMEAHTSFAAVDRLVSRCEEYSRMIKTEMTKWGITAGEDSQSEDGSRQDSGIGTPTGSYARSRSRRLSCSKDITKEKFITQPSKMSKDVILKDYQLIGLNWLNLLWNKKLSCILADEMGLGKTCQVIAFLTHLKEQGVPGPHLIVVPASTLVNWLREFQKFSPELEVQPYHGSEAERRTHGIYLEDNRDEIDVIVTTYEMAVKKADNSVFRRIKPTICVFDEGHALKNKNSQRYNMLMRIPAQFRLLLTGTPLQNNLQELVSILAFIMPSMFEDCNEDLEYIFKHRAKTTDADHAALLSAQRISRARSMITPFMLRRKKATVLMDLPKKTGKVEYCDMTPRQKELYEEHSAYHREHLSARAKGQETDVAVNFLMNRRKAALHPLLFRHHFSDAKVSKIARLTPKKRSFKTFKNEECLKEWFEGYSDIGLHKHCVELQEKEGIKTAKLLLQDNEWMDSGKVKKLAEMLRHNVANGDRTLLFSQFTMVLDILELVLNTLQMPFLRIDGTTPVTIRQDLIDQFYADASIPVFMLSTRSGGTGINLSCANRVVIFDSSFNPQDDIQAENRAHRVGQTREVEVVRLVTRGTVEEQIHALGNSKIALDERVAGDRDEAAGKEAEKKGQDLIEKMLMQTEAVAKAGVVQGESEGKDLKEVFKDGLLARA